MLTGMNENVMIIFSCLFHRVLVDSQEPLDSLASRDTEWAWPHISTVVLNCLFTF